jgi:hypothetical protein
VPTFVAFTPWTTPSGYVAFLEQIHVLDLVDVVAPVQLVLRLLLPSGSALLDDAHVRRVAGRFDPEALAHPWTHPDPVVDRLHEELMAWLGQHGRRTSRAAAYIAIRRLADGAAGRTFNAFAPDDVLVRATVPYLDEPWYC